VYLYYLYITCIVAIQVRD